MSYLNSNEMLDGYILWLELMRKAELSSNAYRFWGGVKAAKYEGSRVVFLEASSVLSKYISIANECFRLDGYIQSQAFCKFSSLAPSNLVASNNGALHKILGILVLEGVKFVNMRLLLKAFNIPQNSTIYIERCSYFAPLEKKVKLTKKLCLGYY